VTTWLAKDAQNRAWRTILQGLVATILLPAVIAGLEVVQTSLVNPAQTFDWRRVAGTAGFAAATAGMMALTAYLHRLKLDPSAVASAQPPRPPGVSEAQAPATAPAVGVEVR
jgi:hypothetical protein